MGHFRELGRRTNIVLGIGLIVAMVGSVALSLALYNGTFAAKTTVVLMTDRAGLLLEKGSDVKLNGAVVGHVDRVVLADGRAKIELAMDDDQIGAIPSNVTASIDPSTLLGRKFVTLTRPDNASSRALGSGDVLVVDTVGTEINELLTSLVHVLDEVNPQKVSNTLNALSTALAGTGDAVGALVQQLDGYLAEFNPHLGRLRADLVSTSVVAQRLSQASPALLATVENLTVTSKTLTTHEKQLSAFILSFSAFGRSGEQLFRRGGIPLERAARSLAAPSSLLGEFSGVLPCFLANLAQTNRYLENTNSGSARPGLNIVGTLLMGNPPYSYPQNLPKVGLSGTAPSCRSIPTGPIPHTNFNDGSDAYRPIRNATDLIGNPLADLLFGGR